MEKNISFPVPIDKKSKNNKKNDTSNKVFQQREIYGK